MKFIKFLPLLLFALIVNPCHAQVVAGKSDAPVGLTFDDYLARIKNPGKLVLVDFNAVWCGPCKMMKPIVNRQVKKNSDKVELLEIDVDKNPAVANTMNIKGIPLFIIYKQGKEVWRNMGLTDESELADKIKQFSFVSSGH